MFSNRRISHRVLSLLLPVLVVALLAPAVLAASADHLIITEVMIKERNNVPALGSQFVKIANPTGSAIDMSDYYLSNANFSPTWAYYRITQGDLENAHPGGGNGYFHCRFPAGYSIAAGADVTISIKGSDAFMVSYGVLPDFELFEDGESLDGVPEMVEAFPGAIDAGFGGGASEPNMSDTNNSLILYAWNGSDELVVDVDYVVWGTVLSFRTDKTGVTVGSSVYANDTPVADQSPAPGGLTFGQGLIRSNDDEGTETLTGGNGITFHDETSENLSVTFSVDNVTAPVAPGSFFAVAPMVTSPTVSPAAPADGIDVTLSVTLLSNDAVTGVAFAYSVDAAAYTTIAGIDAGSGVWTATVPAQVEGAVVKWYCTASTAGASTVYPVGGDTFATGWTVIDAPIPGSGPAKLLITEVCTLGSAGEFVEIYNPSSADVDMSDFYLSDAMHFEQGYWLMGAGNLSASTVGGGVYYDFNARFPEGFVIGARDTITVAIAGSGPFFETYDILPSLELYEDNAGADLIPDMRDVFPGSINGDTAPTLTNANPDDNKGEIIALYHYTEGDDLTTDIDIFAWGTGTSYLMTGRNQATVGSSTYAPDSAMQPIPDAHAFGSSYTRVDGNEGTQATTGGNGVDGRDETSENLNTTFELLAATPAAPPEGELGPGGVQLLVPAKTFMPSMGETFTIRFVSKPKSETKVRLFDLEGRLIRTLFDSRKDGAASFTPEIPSILVWDGRTDLYERVKAGMYIAHLSVYAKDTGEESTVTAPVVVSTRLSK